MRGAVLHAANLGGLRFDSATLRHSKPTKRLRDRIKLVVLVKPHDVESIIDEKPMHPPLLIWMHRELPRILGPQLFIEPEAVLFGGVFKANSVTMAFVIVFAEIAYGASCVSLQLQ